MQTIIGFTTDGRSGDRYVVLCFRHDPELNGQFDLIDAIREGLTRWLATSSKGYEFLVSCDDDPPHTWVTAGDMLGFRGNADLDECLAKVGIYEWMEATEGTEDDTWACELLYLWDIEIDWD